MCLMKKKQKSSHFFSIDYCVLKIVKKVVDFVKKDLTKNCKSLVFKCSDFYFVFLSHEIAQTG